MLIAGHKKMLKNYGVLFKSVGKIFQKYIYIKALVKSMPNRVANLLENGGRSLKY